MFAEKIDQLERRAALNAKRSAIIDQMISLLQQGKISSPDYSFAKRLLNHKSNPNGGRCKVIAMSF